MSPSFVHLHLHSEFSLTDSTLRLAPLVQRCVEDYLAGRRFPLEVFSSEYA